MRLPVPLLLLFVACLPQVGPPVDGGAAGGVETDAGAGGGTGGAGGGSAGGTAGGAANPGCPGYAGCTTFTDGTTVTFPNLNDTYSPKCLRVRVGQQVTFAGDFGDHPLEQSCGPAANVINGTATATFTVPGVYGYWCTDHGSSGGSGMAGAIEVVP